MELAAPVTSHDANLSAAWQSLLVKIRQIARRISEEILLGRHAGEEMEIANHVRLIRVAGLERYSGEILSRVPQPADSLQPSQPRKHLRSRAGGDAEVPLQRALAHRDAARQGSNRSSSAGLVNQLRGRLDLRSGSVARPDPLAEKA